MLPGKVPAVAVKKFTAWMFLFVQRTERYEPKMWNVCNAVPYQQTEARWTAKVCVKDSECWRS